MIRDGFRAISTLFVELVDQINEAQWEQPGLGEWTVRELVGHIATASFGNLERGLDQPAAELVATRPVDFWVRRRDSHKTIADADADAAAIAQGGRDAATALGEQPAQAVRALYDRLHARLDATDGHLIITTRIGGMRMLDYLATRVFECAIHTLDLAVALQIEVTIPEPALSMTLQLLGDRATANGHTTALLLAATGRGPLPDGFSVLSMQPLQTGSTST